jgi:hypothetical protein
MTWFLTCTVFPRPISSARIAVIKNRRKEAMNNQSSIYFFLHEKTTKHRNKIISTPI